MRIDKWLDDQLTFYHGAAGMKYDTLKPMIYSGGHKLRKQEWVVFLWHQHQLAGQWAIRAALDLIARKHNLHYPVFKFEKVGLDDYNMKIGIKINELEKFKLAVKSDKVKFYIYTAKIKPQNISKLGMGNTATAPEYTYTEEIKPSKVEEFILNLDYFDKFVMGLDDANYNDWYHNRPNMRGVLKPMYDEDSLSKYGYVWDQVSAGKIKPGDDLDIALKGYKEETTIEESSETDNKIFISEDDIYLNYDKWVTGKSHVLLVNGLAASGKSTLAKKLAAEDDDALYCELDILTFSIVGAKSEARGNCTMGHIQSKNPLLAKWMKETNKDPRMFADIKVDPITWFHPPEDEERILKAVDEFLEWICFKQKKRCIIEGLELGITIARFPEKYKKVPMIFKGTSLMKSIIRRIKRYVGKKGLTVELFTTFFHSIVEQYRKTFSEMNAARMAMLKNRDSDEVLYVKEAKMFPEDLLEEGWKASIRNFNQFCQEIKKPNDVMKWFKKNKVKWNKNGNDEPFHWPDDLIKEKTGNCFDQTLFMHYFCKKKRLENRIFLISWQSRVNGSSTGHAVPVYRQGKYVYTFIYLSKGNGVIGGPFEDFNEAQEVLDKFFQVYVNKMFKTPVYVYSSYLDENDTARFDQYYGRKDITQAEYITMNHGANMRSSHLYKMNLRGFTFWNPILPIFDLLDAAIRILSKNGKGVKMEYENFFESVDIHNEASVGHYDKYGNYKLKSDSTYVDMDPNADEEEYKRRIEYVYLKDAKYSAKPQPVIWYGDHDYRARCEVIILKGDKILLDRTKDRGGSGYSLPGGGINTRESFAAGAARECEEEAMIIPKNIRYMDICWREEFPKPKVYNDGSISFVCVANYGRAYDGRVADEDKDEFVDRAKWENYRDARLIEPHRLAIERYLGRAVFEQATINEDKLKADERTNFGIPSKKKYPMPDEQHVRSAITYFNRCDPEDEAILARNILKYMKKYKMKPVNVSKDNKFYKYYHPKEINEAFILEKVELV